MHHEVIARQRKLAWILRQQNQYTISPFKPQYLAQESVAMALKNSCPISYNKKEFRKYRTKFGIKFMRPEAADITERQVMVWCQVIFGMQI